MHVWNMRKETSRQGNFPSHKTKVQSFELLPYFEFHFLSIDVAVALSTDGRYSSTLYSFNVW